MKLSTLVQEGARQAQAEAEKKLRAPRVQIRLLRGTIVDGASYDKGDVAFCTEEDAVMLTAKGIGKTPVAERIA